MNPVVQCCTGVNGKGEGGQAQSLRGAVLTTQNEDIRALLTIGDVNLFKIRGMFNLPSQFHMYIRKGVSVELSSSIGPKKQFSMSFSGSDFVLYTEVGLMEQICTRYPPLFSHIERLELGGAEVKYRYLYPLNAPWLEFLQPFAAAKTLQLSEPAILLCVSRTLGELSEEEATEVLPALHTLLLARDQEDASEAARSVGPFIVARKHSGHPVVLKLYSWDAI